MAVHPVGSNVLSNWVEYSYRACNDVLLKSSQEPAQWTCKGTAVSGLLGGLRMGSKL